MTCPWSGGPYSGMALAVFYRAPFIAPLASAPDAGLFRELIICISSYLDDLVVRPNTAKYV
jgi:hypothetical protein